MDSLNSIGISRADFLKLVGGTSMVYLTSRFAAAQSEPTHDDSFIFLEAEQFNDLGGWVVDQQSMDQMGSSYLLAHGLGVPVKNATTSVKVTLPGTYRVWVRTRDWVAPWNAPGAPGKFQLLINDVPLAKTFGIEGANWHWQDGGTVVLTADTKVALHDLTGFEGRCDAVLFSKDATFQPPNELMALTKFRRDALGLSDKPDDGGDFDLVVVGGGIAGTSAALSAARNGLKVALVQDRPVLGGNGSSEIRVWPEGHTLQKPYPHIGEIVEELVPKKAHGDGNARDGAIYGDARKTNVVLAEARITLLTDHRVFAVETNAGHISAVIAQDIITARRVRLTGKLFADCTGDATVGFLAGADYETSKDDHQGMSNLWNLTQKPALDCECTDKTALGQATVESNVPQPFPRCPWAIDLSDKPFPGRPKDKTAVKPAFDKLGAWNWESGFDRDPITDVERIRDLNLRAMYGAWDALKNVDQLYPNYRIGWAAYIAGKRESRRLLGDVILDADDFLSAKAYPDGCFPCTWAIDLHEPDKAYQAGNEGNEFIAASTAVSKGSKKYDYKGPYWAPYRCLYSRNIDNLFMAGRDISVTHEGLGPVRVMRTCGMMGEIVGKAASICVSLQTSPRGVYASHLDTLKDLMAQPGATRQA
jgi:hypothetical protein